MFLRGLFKPRKVVTQATVVSLRDDSAYLTDFARLLSEYFNTHKKTVTRFDVMHLMHLLDHVSWGDAFVAYVNGEAVGCVAFERMRVRDTRPYGNELSRLYVQPKYRNHNIAKQLMRRVAETAVKQKVERITIVISERDARLFNWYSRMGFVSNAKAKEAGSEGVLYMDAPSEKLLENLQK